MKAYSAFNKKQKGYIGNGGTRYTKTSPKLWLNSKDAMNAIRHRKPWNSKDDEFYKDWLITEYELFEVKTFDVEVDTEK